MAFGKYSPVKLSLGMMMIAVPQTGFAQNVTPETLATNRAQALTCLAQAISYEAGNESVAGQEAVAQVILNRLRHPAYPKTICGVVYQGSERKTGCQFTFTCDGSLRRPRSAQSMSFATAIAERVLNGGTSAIVGGATHYHADYVSPYWAPSLVKIATIGAHIFYRMPGAPDFPAVANIDYARGEATVLATPEISKPTPPGASQFSPWGLPTLSITPSGRIKATGE
jgi:spore germination cell wall hydrolase CwlJ-like protein